MQPGIRAGQVFLPEEREQCAIQSFDRIVAPLIGCVNPPLYVCQLGVTRARSPSFVFDMPEFEISAMLARYLAEERIANHRRFQPIVPVPEGDQFVLEMCDI